MRETIMSKNSKSKKQKKLAWDQQKHAVFSCNHEHQLLKGEHIVRPINMIFFCSSRKMNVVRHPWWRLEKPRNYADCQPQPRVRWGHPGEPSQARLRETGDKCSHQSLVTISGQCWCWVPQPHQAIHGMAPALFLCGMWCLAISATQSPVCTNSPGIRLVRKSTLIYCFRELVRIYDTK